MNFVTSYSESLPRTQLSSIISYKCFLPAMTSTNESPKENIELVYSQLMCPLSVVMRCQFGENIDTGRGNEARSKRMECMKTGNCIFPARLSYRREVEGLYKKYNNFPWHSVPATKTMRM